MAAESAVVFASPVTGSPPVKAVEPNGLTTDEAQDPSRKGRTLRHAGYIGLPASQCPH